MNEFQELYYRIYVKTAEHFACLSVNGNKLGRSMPLTLRHQEELVVPNLQSAFDHIAFLTVLIQANQDHDFVTSEFLNSCFDKARACRWQGQWKFFIELAYHFDIPFDVSLEDNSKVIQEFSPNGKVQRLNRRNLQTKHDNEITKVVNLEGTVMSPYYYANFLKSQMPEDEIFGNLLRRGVLILTRTQIRVRYSNMNIMTDKRPVSQPTQIGRGYKDKGTLASYNSRARREANKSTDKHKLPKYNSEEHIVTWGLKPEDSGGG